MKIGIITFHCAYNYGAVLQAYALQEYLKSFDYDVSILDYRPNSIIDDYSFFGSVKNARTVIKKIFNFGVSILKIPEKTKRNKSFLSFTKHFQLDENFIKADYDLIICGSDQIWNPKLTNGLDKNFFAHFSNGKKISYAVSDGGELEYSDEVIKLLLDFDSISVREKQMKYKIKSVLPNMKVQTVCDPVFLLTKEQWKEIAILPKEKNYIFLYKVMQNGKIDLEVRKFAKTKGKKVIELIYTKSLKKFFVKEKGVQKKCCVTPQEFLGFLANADYVFTTSFHATAFSMIFNKKFVTYEIPNRSDRIITLLNESKLLEHYVSNLNDVIEKEYKVPNIDFIQESKQFLNEALKGGKLKE